MTKGFEDCQECFRYQDEIKELRKESEGECACDQCTGKVPMSGFHVFKPKESAHES